MQAPNTASTESDWISIVSKYSNLSRRAFGFAHFLLRLLAESLRRESLRQQRVNGSVLRIQARRGSQLGDRFIGLPLIKKHLPQSPVGRRVIRRHLDCLTK